MLYEKVHPVYASIPTNFRTLSCWRARSDYPLKKGLSCLKRMGFISWRAFWPFIDNKAFLS